MSSESRYVYTVRCEIDDAGARSAWLDWLESQHVADVCDAGALEAWIVLGDDEAARIDVHYVFADRAAFERYERDHAPRLRAHGLARPEAEFVRFSRSRGERTAVIRPRGAT